ncbi:MAG TPA: hypothetical protein VK841_24115 [Polyangiaceae bacterium]|jgi:hypothetical protein|nr:hypothetical protein [Polyangiaceae bacterium]
MACEIIEYRRVMLVVWGTPELPDFQRILSRLAGLHASVGPIVFIARVPANAAPPDEKMRKEVSRMLPLIASHCASYHAVFEGVGFVASAKRAILSTMFLMSAGRKRYHVHASVAEVERAVSLESRSDVAAAIVHFRSEGGLDHTLQSLPPARRRFFGRSPVYDETRPR